MVYTILDVMHKPGYLNHRDSICQEDTENIPGESYKYAGFSVCETVRIKRCADFPRAKTKYR